MNVADGDQQNCNAESEECQTSETNVADDCVDGDSNCKFWAESGECSANPGYMLAVCLKACNVCPLPGRGALAGLSNMEAAMRRPDCQNGHEECENWATAGECSANPSYMLTNCARACNTCHLLDAEVRCRPMPGRELALEAGGYLNATFHRATDPDGPFAHLKPRILSDDPWVVVFDDFMTDDEVSALIEKGGQSGFSESVDAGKRLPNGSFAAIKSTARTSETAWCVDDFCTKDPRIEAVTARIADVSRVPYQNSEYLQVLRYHPGQYYVDHHDYIPGHLEMPCGPRLYTFFLYLSDVEEGGGTAFNRLVDKSSGEKPLIVQPAKGRALLWPSVMDRNPFEKDLRTHHEATPVTKGIKFAANAWLHMYNFKEPFKVGCTG